MLFSYTLLLTASLDELNVNSFEDSGKLLKVAESASDDSWNFWEIINPPTTLLDRRATLKETDHGPSIVAADHRVVAIQSGFL